MPDTTEHFTKALNHHRAGQLAAAASEYEQVLAGDPTHVAALSNLAALRGSEGRHDEAARYYARALEQQPADVATLTNYGHMLAATGARTEAESYYRRALESDENNAVAWAALGSLCFAAGRNEDAADHYGRAVEIEPASAKARTNLGAALHALGRYDEARASLEAARDLEPNNPDARNALGIVYAALHRDEQAIDEFQRTIALRPGWAEPVTHLARALDASGRPDDALAALARAAAHPDDTVSAREAARRLIVAGRPDEAEPLLAGCPRDDPEAEFVRGMIEAERGRHEQAMDHFERARQGLGEVSDILSNIGACLCALDRNEEAVEVLMRAAKANPTQPDVVNNLGSALLALGQHADAYLALRRADELKPNSPVTLHNLGMALSGKGQLGRAVEHFERALGMRPDFTAAYVGRGNAGRKQGEYDAAIASYCMAAVLQPDDGEIHYNLSVCLMEAGLTESAFDWAWSGMRANPHFAPLYTALGTAMRAMKAWQIALNVYRSAVDLDPGNLDTRRYIASTYERCQKLEEAAAAHVDVLNIDPTNAESLAHMVNIILTVCDWRYYDEFVRHLIESTERQVAAGVPVSVDVINLHALPVSQELTYRAAATRAREDMRRAEEARRRNAFSFPVRNRERIRIGYVLPYTWFSSMPLVLHEIVSRHDRARFEVHGYCIAKSADTRFDRSFRASFDHFHDLPQAAPERAARMIHRDEIDVLIDTTGHTANNVLGVMAHRPAPVQAHFLGYGLTSGGTFLDYLITDPVYIPLEDARFCSEKLVHMPDTFLPTVRAPISAEPVARSHYYLPDDGIVFCNFNMPAKFEPVIFSAWMRILHAVAGAVMWFGAWNPTMQRNLRNEAVKRGMAPERLIFAEQLKHPQHLKRLQLADLALDNLYHQGGVTNIDYMWAGLPTLTVRGETPPQRLGATVLSAAGMHEMIVPDLDTYERRAVELAEERQELVTLRTRLWDQRLTCPLFDGERFVRHLETGYEMMWQRRVDGHEPDHITIPRLAR